LKHEDACVRHEATCWLGEIDGRQAVRLLIAALADSSALVRSEAARCLGRVGGRQAVRPLIKALSDGEAEVRRAALSSLGKIDGKEVAHRLVGALKDKDAKVRSLAASVLGKAGEKQAVQPLLVALTDREVAVRVSAAEALGEIGDPAALKPLLAALRSADWRLRGAAARGLGKLGHADAVEPLIDALGDDAGNVIDEASRALARIGKPAVEGLTARFRARESKHRARLLSALAAADEARRVALSVAALKDPDPTVRRAAVDLLARGGRRAAQVLLAELGPEAHVISPDLTDEQVEGVEDLCWFYLWDVADILGKINDRSVIPDLMKVLNEGKWDNRVAAVRALGHLRAAEAAPLLASQLERGAGLLRWDAAEALRKIGPPAAPHVVGMVKSREDETRKLAAEALGGIGAREFVPALLKMYEEGDAFARHGAAMALGHLKAVQAAQPMLAALAQDRPLRLRCAAAEAVGRIGDTRAAKCLLAMLEDKEGPARAAAARGLGHLGKKEAVPALVAASSDTAADVRRAAVEALGRFRDVRTLWALDARLRDKDLLVQRAAGEALGELLYGPGHAVEAP